MNKLLLPFGLALLILAGCKEDFDVSAPYKDITVVYGLLDNLDTAHYVRIQKAFLDENKSAIEMSKEADSSFYKSLIVKMQELTANGQFMNETILERVDMNKEGYPKNPPANNQGFFNDKNFAYKFKKVLDPYRAYRLIITNTATGDVDSSQLVRVVNSDTTKSDTKTTFYIQAFADAAMQVDFAKTSLESYVYRIIGHTPVNGYMYEAKIHFRYVDRNVVTGAQEDKTVDLYIPSRPFEENEDFRIEMKNKDIFAFLRDEIGAAPPNVERYMDSVDVYVYSGSRDLNTYVTANNAQAGGLTGDQIKPNITNMKGDDIFGILASRTYRKYTNAPLSQATIDSLRVNPVTQALGIKGRSDH